MDKICVFLIEDNSLLREGILALIQHNKYIELVACSNDEDIIRKAKELVPRIVLIDMSLKDQDSLQFISTIRAELPDTRIIIMGFIPTQTDVIDYVKAGVSGFILKNASFDEFVDTIRTVADGHKVLPPAMTGSLFSQIAEYAIKSGKSIKDESIRMTNRELEIIALIGEGLTNKEIAQQLHIATYTVKSHVHNILEKLALRSRLQIAAYALKKGS